MSADGSGYCLPRSALAAFLAGLGFCLAFGWVWFEAVFGGVCRSAPLMPDGGPFFGGGISLFFCSLAVSLALLCAARRFLPLHGRSASLLGLHGLSLLALALAGALPGLAPRAGVVAMGASSAFLGVAWAGLLLNRPPFWSGLALAWAALLACLPLAAPIRLEVWPGVCPGVWLAGSYFSLLQVCALAGLSLLCARLSGQDPPIRLPAPASARPVPGGFGSVGSLDRSPTLWRVAGCFAPSMFTLGVLSALFSSAAAASLDWLFYLQACVAAGAVPAVALRRVLEGRTRRLSGLLPAMALASGIAVTLTVLSVTVFAPVFFPFNGFALALGDGFVSAALVMEAAAILAWDRRAATGAILLLFVFLTVNAGGAVGITVARRHFGQTVWVVLSLAVVGSLFIPARALRAARRPTPLAPMAGSETSTALPQGASAPQVVTSTAPETSPPHPLLGGFWPHLTPRERAVAELIADGRTNTDICARLYLSENTVRTHLKNIYRKTGAEGREALIRLLKDETSHDGKVPGLRES